MWIYDVKYEKYNESKDHTFLDVTNNTLYSFIKSIYSRHNCESITFGFNTIILKC